MTELRLPDGVHYTLDHRDDSMHVETTERGGDVEGPVPTLPGGRWGGERGREGRRGGREGGRV